MQDYAELLGGNGRYAGVLGTGTDSAAFAKALQRGGYATDPDYASKLAGVARRPKVAPVRADTRRDRLIAPKARSVPRGSTNG